MRRALARASATLDVSITIQRRPHCSATYAVVPEPQVGSSTKSPGSVVIKIQRLTTSGLVSTTYVGFAGPLSWVQRLLSGTTGESVQYCRAYNRRPVPLKRPARARRNIPSGHLTDQWRPLGGSYTTPWKKNG